MNLVKQVLLEFCSCRYSSRNSAIPIRGLASGDANCFAIKSFEQNFIWDMKTDTEIPCTRIRLVLRSYIPLHRYFHYLGSNLELFNCHFWTRRIASCASETSKHSFRTVDASEAVSENSRLARYHQISVYTFVAEEAM